MASTPPPASIAHAASPATAKLGWIWEVIAILLVHLAYGATVLRTFADTLVDDAAITFAYTESLVATGTFAIRPGEVPLEALSNLLWCLLLVPFEVVGVDLRIAVVVLSGLVSCVCAFLIANGWRPASPLPLAPWHTAVRAAVSACVLLGGLHWSLWLCGGLEGPLVGALWLGVLLLNVGDRRGYNRPGLLALLVSCVFLTRPDGILVPFAILAVASVGDVAGATTAARGTILRRYAGLAAAASAVFVAAGLIRYAIWSFPLPNSFLAKAPAAHGGSRWANWEGPGWTYVRTFYDEYPMALLALGLALSLLARKSSRRDAGLVLAAIAAGHVMPIYAGGDWMSEWRLLTYLWPVLALVLFSVPSRITTYIAPRKQPQLVPVLVTTTLVSVAGASVVTFAMRLEVAGTTIRLPLREIEQRGDMWASAANTLGILWPHVADPDAGGNTWRRQIRFTDVGKLADYVLPRIHPSPQIGLRGYFFEIRNPDFVHLHGAWDGAYALQEHWEFSHRYVGVAPTLRQQFASHGRDVVDARLFTLDSFVSPYTVASLPTNPPDRGDEPQVALLFGFHDQRNGVVRVALATSRFDFAPSVSACGETGQRATPMQRVGAEALDAVEFPAQLGPVMTVWSAPVEARDCLQIAFENYDATFAVTPTALPSTIEEVAAQYSGAIGRQPALLFARGMGPLAPMAVQAVCGGESTCLDALRADETLRTTVIDAALRTVLPLRPGPDSPHFETATQAILEATWRSVGAPPLYLMPDDWRASRQGCDRVAQEAARVSDAERWPYRATPICSDSVAWTAALADALVAGLNPCATNARALERRCWEAPDSVHFSTRASCLASARAGAGDLSGVFSALQATPDAVISLLATDEVPGAYATTCLYGDTLAHRLSAHMPAGSRVNAAATDLRGQLVPTAVALRQHSDGCGELGPSECIRDALRLAPAQSAVISAGCTLRHDAPTRRGDARSPWVFAPVVLVGRGPLEARGLRWDRCGDAGVMVESVLLAGPAPAD